MGRLITWNMVTLDGVYERLFRGTWISIGPMSFGLVRSLYI